MPYKYIEKTEEPTHPPSIKPQPIVTETKEVEKPKVMTEDEQQELYTNEQHGKFFEEDEDIIEVNFD